MGEKTRRGSSAASARAVRSASLKAGIGAAIVARSTRQKMASPIAILIYENDGRNVIGRRKLHPTAEPQERAFLVAAQLKHWGAEGRGTDGIGGPPEGGWPRDDVAVPVAPTAAGAVAGEWDQVAP